VRGSVRLGRGFLRIGLFRTLYEWAEGLIRAGHAYVDDQSRRKSGQARTTDGHPSKQPVSRPAGGGKPRLFSPMKAASSQRRRVLRAKIECPPAHQSAGPACLRILQPPSGTGDQMVNLSSYDYAHGQSDAIEGVTPFDLTLEFETTAAL